MADDENYPPHDLGESEPPPPPPPGKLPGMQVVDRRRPERITVPFYIIERYGHELGPLGLAVYLGLCFHVAKTRIVWPSYGTLAREIGCSRSTIERQMRLLKDLGLVLVEPHYEGKRQSSNIIYLVDPGTSAQDVLRAPPRSRRGGAVYWTAPAPSIRRRGSRSTGSRSREGGKPPPRCFASTQRRGKAPGARLDATRRLRRAAPQSRAPRGGDRRGR